MGHGSGRHYVVTCVVPLQFPYHHSSCSLCSSIPSTELQSAEANEMTAVIGAYLHGEVCCRGVLNVSLVSAAIVPR